MRLLLGFFLLAFGASISIRSRRWKRQVLPSQHVQIHSLDSNVVYNNDIYVESTENRIDVHERTFNGSIWSDHSLLNFDSLDTFLNVSADNTESFLNIVGGAILHGQGIKSDLYIHTNRTQNGNSAISQSMAGLANFSIEDEALRVQAVNGKKIALEAETWKRSMEPKMTLNAETTRDLQRELRLEALGEAYHVLATYSGSTMFINFANKIIRLGNDYRNVEIFTDKYNVTVITRDAPYDITLTQEEVIINLSTQRTRICVTLDGVNVKSNQVTKTHVEKNNGIMTVGGKKIEENGATLIAGATSLDLNNAGTVAAELTNSRLIVDNNIQKIDLVSGHHTMMIDQGFPKITVDPGESCVEILANRGLPHFADIIPPFKWPQDKFKNIGPFDGNYQAETEFLNKPSCCSIGGIMSSSGLQTSSGEWSEWGNNGNNGGWNTGGSGTFKPHEPTGITKSKTAITVTPHAPQFGHWPTFSTNLDTFTRKVWPENFNTDSTPADWEKEEGCNCKSTTSRLSTTGAPIGGVTSKNSATRVTVSPNLQTEELPTEGTANNETTLPIESHPSGTQLGTEENIIGSLDTTTSIPSNTEEPISALSSSVQPITEQIPLTEAEESTFPRPDEDIGLPTELSKSKTTETLSEIGSTPQSFPTIGHVIEVQDLFPPPQQVVIDATVSTVQVNSNEDPNVFPAPNSIASMLNENGTESIGDWSGGASDLQTTFPTTDGFPSPLFNNTSFVKRSPLLLTLRLPPNAVGRRTDIATTIRESIRRVIRGTSKHRIAKRELNEQEDFVKITSIKEQNGTLEVVFSMADSGSVDEKDLLSLTNQEISKYFEYPVISLTRLEELGDNRFVYIVVALGLIVMTLFCLVCIFQTIVKQMSQALLVSLGRRFHKLHPGDISQY